MDLLDRGLLCLILAKVPLSRSKIQARRVNKAFIEALGDAASYSLETQGDYELLKLPAACARLPLCKLSLFLFDIDEAVHIPATLQRLDIRGYWGPVFTCPVLPNLKELSATVYLPMNSDFRPLPAWKFPALVSFELFMEDNYLKLDADCATEITQVTRQLDQLQQLQSFRYFNPSLVELSLPRSCAVYIEGCESLRSGLPAASVKQVQGIKYWLTEEAPMFDLGVFEQFQALKE